jgi:hypothetical protein
MPQEFVVLRLLQLAHMVRAVLGKEGCCLFKAPVITVGELIPAESGAIFEYLVDRYSAGKFAPAIGTPERLRYTYWLHYAEGSAMPLW